MNLRPRFGLSLVPVTLLLLAGCSDEPDTNIVVSGDGDTSTGGTFLPGSGGNAPASGGAGAASSGGTAPGSGGSVNPSSGGAANPTGGSGGSGSGGDTAQGTGGEGTLGTGGEGTVGTGGSNGTDQGGKMDAMLGEKTNIAQDYLKLGEIRILNNNWGSEDLGCTNSTFEVYVDPDRTFGWNFNRGDCANDTSHPDFPQVEFGIHPFGIGSDLVTSPEFSSTPLLPLQLKDITSASVTLDDLSIQGNLSQWNLTMEFWLSEGDPRNAAGSVSVHTELMTWWGWNNSWDCDVNPDNVSAGTKSYTLCHQADNWASGWRYYQFRADGGNSPNFTGTVDVKSFIDYLMTKPGYHGDLWLTRMEVGTEIDDNNQGTVRMKNITFEVNSQSRSPTFSE